MNVTKENLAEAAEQIEALLPSAEFVAIDEEMTGITLPGQPEQIQDVPAVRYAKMRNVASRYSIIQFGVCLFHKTEDGQGYMARPYNFYVFPEAGAINMEGSSIGFLRTHKMDFNKWIYEGIPYVNSAVAQKLHASMLPKEEPAKAEEKRDPMKLTKKSDIELTDKALASIREWLADESKKDETELKVITTNPYIRRFLYENVAAQFPQLLAESRPVPGGYKASTFVVLRLTEEQRAARAAEARKAKEKDYTQKIGFRRVFTALADAKKPIVGHNCMYDLLFMMASFEGPLPESYSGFKELFVSRFPLLLDTKLLATREPFKFRPRAAENGGPAEREHRFGSTALGEVFNVFEAEAKAAREAGRPTVGVAFAPGFDRYANDASAAHEAGYDAYMTGYAFAHMAKDALSPERLAALRGRTPMFRSLFDFTLSGEDRRLHEGVYVHVAGLTGRDAAELKGAFAEVKAPAGAEPEKPAEAAPVEIRWINDDSAFAVLPEACAGSVAAMLERSRSCSGMTFTPGDEWFAAQTAAAEGTSPAEPPAKRARTD